MLKFGIELEVARYDFDRAHALLDKLNMSSWVYKTDGSISPTPGVEFNSPVLSWERTKSIMPLIEGLKEDGAITNDTCGIHIHVSGNFPSFEDSIPLFHRWYAKHRKEFRPCPRRRERHAREVIDPETFIYGKGKIIHNWAPQHIELRLFDAKLDCRWMSRCLLVSKQLGIALEKLKIRLTKGN